MVVVVIILHVRDGRPDGSADAVFETARDARRVVSGVAMMIVTPDP